MSFIANPIGVMRRLGLGPKPHIHLVKAGEWVCVHGLVAGRGASPGEALGDYSTRAEDRRREAREGARIQYERRWPVPEFNRDPFLGVGASNA